METIVDAVPTGKNGEVPNITVVAIMILQNLFQNQLKQKQFLSEIPWEILKMQCQQVEMVRFLTLLWWKITIGWLFSKPIPLLLVNFLTTRRTMFPDA